MVKNGNMKKNKKNSFWTWKKMSRKSFRILLGITMFYSFIALANMIHFVIQLSALTSVINVIGYFTIWFFPPLALITLTYYLLTNTFPPEEKKHA